MRWWLNGFVLNESLKKLVLGHDDQVNDKYDGNRVNGKGDPSAPSPRNCQSPTTWFPSPVLSSPVLSSPVLSHTFANFAELSAHDAIA